MAAIGLPFSDQAGVMRGTSIAYVTTKVAADGVVADLPDEPRPQERPVESPAPALPPPAPLPAPAPEPDRCADALAWVAGQGLVLPKGVAYHCPSTRFAHQGAACWNWGPCRGHGFIAINMGLLEGTTTEYLRYVVAHEVCHIHDFRRTGKTSEAAADACAAAHGAPA